MEDCAASLVQNRDLDSWQSRLFYPGFRSGKSENVSTVEVKLNHRLTKCTSWTCIAQQTRGREPGKVGKN